MCVLNKAKLDSELSNNITLPSLQKFVTHFLLGTFYSYRTARTCSEPRTVQRRLSFAVEVTTTSGNWKHPLPLKIIFNTRFQWLLCFKNCWHLTPPTLRHPRTAPQKCVSRTYIYIYIYLLVMCSYSTIMASELDQHNYKL